MKIKQIHSCSTLKYVLNVEISGLISENFEIYFILESSINGKYKTFIAPLQRCKIQSKNFSQKNIGDVT